MVARKTNFSQLRSTCGDWPAPSSPWISPPSATSGVRHRTMVEHGGTRPWLRRQGWWADASNIESVVKLPLREMALVAVPFTLLELDVAVDEFLAQGTRAVGGSFRRSLRASSRFWGSHLDPPHAFARLRTCWRPRACPGRVLWAMPSSPAASTPACIKYGLAEPSMSLNSNRPGSGMRTIVLRLLPP